MERDSVLLSRNGFFSHEPVHYHLVVDNYKDWMDHHYSDQLKDWMAPKLFDVRIDYFSIHSFISINILLSLQIAQFSEKVQTDEQIDPHNRVLILFTGCKWITKITSNFTGTEIDNNVIDHQNENLWLGHGCVNELNSFWLVDFCVGDLTKLTRDCPHRHFIASGKTTSVDLTILCVLMIKHEVYGNDSKDWKLIFNTQLCFRTCYLHFKNIPIPITDKVNDIVEDGNIDLFHLLNI